MVSISDPTQERRTKELSKVIEGIIYDDREKEFPIQVEYIYNRWMGRTRIEWIGEPKLCPDAVIDPTNLDACVRDLIREEEGSCEFEG